MFLLFLLLGAAPTGSELAQAIRAYEQLDYRGARVILLRMVEEPDLGKAERIQVLAYLARAHAVLGETARAERRFFALLAIDPDYSVTWEESPRIQEVFARAREEMERKRAREEMERKRAREEMERKQAREETERKQAMERKRAQQRRKKVEARRGGPRVTPKRKGAQPDPVVVAPARGPTSPPDDDGDMTWRIVAGVGVTVALGVIVSILVVSAGGEDEPVTVPTATWRLP